MLQVRSTFGNWAVGKVHAVVGAKRTSKSKRKPFSERFWKLSCSKSARSSGAKQISKLKCAKHTTFGACLEVEMWKSACSCGTKHMSKSKCAKHTTPLWRKARFEVKSVKNRRSRTIFGKWDVGKRARRCGMTRVSKSNALKTDGLGLFLEVGMLKKCTALWREAHSEVKMRKTHHVWTNFARSTAPHYTTTRLRLHNDTTTQPDSYTTTQLHNYTVTQLHSYKVTQLHSYTVTQLHNYTVTQLHSYTVTQLHSYTITQLHSYTTTHHNTTQRNATQRNAAQHTTHHTQHNAAQHTTHNTHTTHNSTLHYTTLQLSTTATAHNRNHNYYNYSYNYNYTCNYATAATAATIALHYNHN